MFTVCSKCNLRLTVTATDLRAAQGYVRCGRCHNVFNALAALADDPARSAEALTTADTQSRRTLAPPEPEQPEAPAPAPDTSEADKSLEFNPASTNIYEVFIEAAGEERTGTFESITLVGEDPVAAEVVPAEPAAPATPAADAAPAPPAATDEPAGLAEPITAPEPVVEIVEPIKADEPAVAAEPREAVEAVEAVEPVLPVQAVAPAEPVEPEEPVESDAAAGPQGPTPSSEAVEPPMEPGGLVDAAAAREIANAMAAAEEPITAEAAQPQSAVALLAADQTERRLPRWAVRAIAAALVLCLIVQVVHHYRSELADTSVLRRPLTAIYQSLGQPLAPRWDIASYEIRQLGASTDGVAPGNLLVRASISNRAARDQPLPLLRVVMQDRFGNRVAARDLIPAEYLERGAPQVSLMAPGQRVDVQVAFQDPGQAATGFEIDACMALRDHNVTCANDTGNR
jgi:predicted Zn finger-like uncharacterized protein